MTLKKIQEKMPEKSEKKEKLENIQAGLNESARGVFSVEDKTKIRERILSFMEAHPIAIISPDLYYLKPTGALWGLSIPSGFRFSGAALAVLLTLGGGVSYAAQGAVPGDSLYGVKTNINEEVRSLLAVSTAQAARLQVEFAEERMKETEKLASKGKIETRTAVQLKANFEKHASNAEAKIGELKSENKHQEVLELSSKFESSLKAHQTVLADLQQGNTATSTSNDTPEVNDLILSVGDQINSTAESRTDAEVKIKADMSVDKDAVTAKMKLARDKIDAVSSLVQTFSEKLTKKSTIEVKRTTDRAEKSYAMGRDKYVKNIYGEALIFFEEANRLGDQAKTYLDTTFELGNTQDKTENTPTPTPSDITTSATSTPLETSFATSSAATSTSAATTTLPEIKIDLKDLQKDIASSTNTLAA